jgi:hypothetical protein
MRSFIIFLLLCYGDEAKKIEIDIIWILDILWRKLHFYFLNRKHHGKRPLGKGGA